MSPKKCTDYKKPKRKAVRTTIELKKGLIAKFESGSRIVNLAAEFKLPKSTVASIIKNKVAIKAADVAKGVTILAANRTQTSNDMENLLLDWISEKKMAGDRITEAIICEKAKQLYADLQQKKPGATGKFKASRGWFDNFKKRSGFFSVAKHGEAASLDVEGEDRKLDMASLVCGNMTENSMGDHPGTSNDDHPMPLSPEQYLTEEIEGPPTQTVSAPRPESYKLRHNNHLSLVLESLADDESFMDVTLTAQGKAIKAHKSVLSAVSSYFKSVLKSNPCQHPIIIMPRDIRFEELNNIISYVYKGEMTVAAEDLPSLLKTAEILQVTGLTPSDSSAMGNTSNNILEQIGGVKGSKTANPTANHTARSVQSPNVAKALNKKAPKFHSTPAGRETFQNVSSYSNDSADKIDPADFLDADMAYVKEEVVSDDERMTDNATDAATDMDSTPQSVQNQADNSNTSQKSCPLSKKRKISVETSSPHVDPGETENNPDLLSDPAVAIQTALFVCPYCFESHRPTEALQAHLSLKHPTKPSFLCKCGKVNIKQTLYEKHMKTCDHS